jgi:hypothetical protein
MTFAEALTFAAAWVGSLEGVESVAEGLSGGEPCITVFVSSPVTARLIPATVGRWKVVVEGIQSRVSS